MKWTKEPWDYSIDRELDDCQIDGSGSTICWVSIFRQEANAKRIVDCVNACENIENPDEYLRHHERIVGNLYNVIQGQNKWLVDQAYGEGFYDDVIALFPTPNGGEDE